MLPIVTSSHFMGDETKAQKNQIICLRLQQLVESKFEICQLAPSILLNTAMQPPFKTYRVFIKCIEYIFNDGL